MNHKTVVLNAAKMNFDGNLDFSVLSEDVTVYDDTDQHQLLARIQGAAVVVTKEMPVGGDLIRQFPDSVKLICEAGTGYNNLVWRPPVRRGSRSATSRHTAPNGLPIRLL